MKIKSKIIGENLKTIANQCFSSEKNMADFFKISPQTFNTYTKGKTEPPLWLLIDLEKLLGVSVMEMFEGKVIIEKMNEPITAYENQKFIDYQIFQLNEPQEEYKTKQKSIEPPKEMDELETLKEKVTQMELAQLHFNKRVVDLEKELEKLKRKNTRMES